MSLLVKLWSVLKRQPKQELTPLVSRKPSFLGRTEYPYKAKCVLTYNGKPIRTFDSIVKSYSRKHAVKQINEGYKVEVQAIHRIKQ